MAPYSKLVGRMLWVLPLQSSPAVLLPVDISTQLLPFAWPSGKGMLRAANEESYVLTKWYRFPWSKVPRYIFAQVLGSFLAGLMLVGQYHPQLTALAAATTARGASLNSLGGPGSILCSFPSPTQTNYGYLFFIEWFVDSFIG
jgi:hypothetical protein